MNIKTNVVDPYVGQVAEGKVVPFAPLSDINKNELKVFLFDSPEQLIITKTKEFQAVCPFSGLPDVAKVVIEYKPKGGKCLELKALKYYLMSFKNVGIYQEGVTAKIYRDLKEVLDTDSLKITTEYNVRGGFYTTCIEGYL